MSNVGIILGVADIKKLRNHFRELSSNLESQLNATEESIEEVAKTWRDENFLMFKNKFEEDKQKIRPLSQKIAEFENTYLFEIERKLIKYTERR